MNAARDEIDREARALVAIVEGADSRTRERALVLHYAMRYAGQRRVDATIERSMDAARHRTNAADFEREQGDRRLRAAIVALDATVEYREESELRHGVASALADGAMSDKATERAADFDRRIAIEAQRAAQRTLTAARDGEQRSRTDVDLRALAHALALLDTSPADVRRAVDHARRAAAQLAGEPAPSPMDSAQLRRWRREMDDGDPELS